MSARRIRNLSSDLANETEAIIGRLGMLVPALEKFGESSSGSGEPIEKIQDAIKTLESYVSEYGEKLSELRDRMKSLSGPF